MSKLLIERAGRQAGMERVIEGIMRVGLELITGLLFAAWTSQLQVCSREVNRGSSHLAAQPRQQF